MRGEGAGPPSVPIHKRRLDAVAAALPPSARVAFDRLRKVEAAYAEAVGRNEVDLSGTARAAMSIEAQSEQDDAFVALVEALGRKEVRGGAEAYRKADAALNAIYGRLMARTDTTAWGTVEKGGIRKTQRAWLVYRDAFVTFARATGADPDAVAHTVTEQRNASLAGLDE